MFSIAHLQNLQNHASLHTSSSPKTSLHLFHIIASPHTHIQYWHPTTLPISKPPQNPHHEPLRFPPSLFPISPPLKTPLPLPLPAHPHNQLPPFSTPPHPTPPHPPTPLPPLPPQEYQTPSYPFNQCLDTLYTPQCSSTTTSCLVYIIRGCGSEGFRNSRGVLLSE